MSDDAIRVPRKLGRLLNVAGPFLGLVLVIALFASLLALQDISRQMEDNGLQGRGGWMQAARESAFDGCHAFVSGANFKIILTQTVVVAICALGMTMIIVSGGIDLSCGSAVALTSVVGAVALVKGCSALTAAALTLVAGIGIGLVNGGLIAGLRMMPFIVTLGMMGMGRGLAKWIAGNQTVNSPESSLNNLMAFVDPTELFPLPPGVWIAMALAVMMAVVMRQTIYGRHVFAVGSNEATARLCGVRVQRQKLFIYALAGFFFGLAGLMQMSRLTQGDPTVAVGLELDVIAAVVIGGASLNGGTGSILGSMIGALIMAVLRNGSNQMGWPNYMQEIIIGVVIIIAVGLDKWRQSRSRA
jgi:ribose transport system permease protein